MYGTDPRLGVTVQLAKDDAMRGALAQEGHESLASTANARHRKA